MIAALEFTNAASLKAHYAALFARKNEQRRNIVSRSAIDRVIVDDEPAAIEPYAAPLVPTIFLDLEEVIASVVWVTRVSRDQLLGRSRIPHIMAARKVLFYLACFHTGLNLVVLGRSLGGVHRTSILHSRESGRAAVREGRGKFFEAIQSCNEYLARCSEGGLE
jgi:Bacterial dnaA protein helix-turn-helix